MVIPGQVLPLHIEKPAVGGRMIARADGQVVLVAGAIPGERVTARIDQVKKGVAYATARTIEEPSADRRDPFTDPACGGCLYAHIAYPRQVIIKGELIADAFSRIGRIRIDQPVPVAPSSDQGYRMRARLHVRAGRIGFFREGTHELCDAAGTRQLLPASCEVLGRLAAGMQAAAPDRVDEIELSENIAGSERVVHLDASSPLNLPSLMPLVSLADGGLTGITVGGHQPVTTVMGSPWVTDMLSIGEKQLTWRRHVLAFFQGNRYLLSALVAHVADRIEVGCRVVDLYAGGGLFSVASAIVRGATVTAVEGDRTSAADLEANAAQAGGAVRHVHQAVETFVATCRDEVDTLILDPPRTGVSKDALAGAISLGARTIVYVSCDMATLARDARRVVDAGYALKRVEGFDMFPNTPHVEAVALFERI